MTTPKLSKSRELAAKVIYAALQILKERGGESPGREVLAEVEKRVTLDEWAKAKYDNLDISVGNQFCIYLALIV